MSTENPILDHSAPQWPLTAELARDRAASSPEQSAADRTAATLAKVDHNLRESSAKANELLVRGVAIVCKTTEMVAYSREAIARSRIALGTKAVARKWPHKRR